METSWTQELLGWVNTHPGWGVAIVFLVAFFESLVLVGILLPGIVILFGIGALVGLGVIELIPVWIAASLGAFLGDTLSYLVGQRFREHLVDVWPFSRYPGMIERGTVFFERHGTKSVMAGRFIGPLRPIIPAVGGMMGMKPAPFVAIDVVACITWAPAFLLPGMLFGASLEVASEYTGRLTVLLVIALAALWLAWWLMRLVYEPLASRSARWLRRAIRWSRRHPVLGRLAGPMLMPSRGEVLSVSMLGLFLVVLFWGFVMLLLLSPFSAQPAAMDQAVNEIALGLRNHLADPVMVGISQLSRWPVSVFAAMALLLWLLGAGRHTAAAHWVVAIIGGGLIHLLLLWTLRTTPQMFEMGIESIRGPSAAMNLVTVTLTFFAVMEAGELQRRSRQWPYIAAALILTMVTLARLYLGMEWLSGALMGILLGLAWTAIVGIAYRQRAKRHFSGSMASLIFYGCFFALSAWQINEHLSSDLELLETPIATVSMDRSEWWAGAWRELPEKRTQVASVESGRFNAQVAVSRPKLSELLQASGWEEVPDTDWRWIVQALNPEPDQASLPLLGRAYQGRSEAILLKREFEDSDRILTIRLWDSGVRLSPGGQTLYLAQLSEEELVQRLGLFSYWRAVPLETFQLEPLREALAELDSKPTGTGLTLIREKEEKGVRLN